MASNSYYASPALDKRRVDDRRRASRITADATTLRQSGATRHDCISGWAGQNQRYQFQDRFSFLGHLSNGLRCYVRVLLPDAHRDGERMRPAAMQPQDELADVALAAFDAGLCVVRVKADGSKRPVAVAGCGPVDPATGERGYGWKAFETLRPDRAIVAEWFAGKHPGIGVVTGEISGNLEIC